MKKLLMLAVAAFAAGSAAAQMNQPIPADPEVRTGKLENGMTYYIRHNEKPKGQADFYILHDVGAIQENDSQQGLAHFLEHMAFNGTKNLPGKQLTEYLETVGVKFGANLNAGTSWDYTCYNMKDVPTLARGNHRLGAADPGTTGRTSRAGPIGNRTRSSGVSMRKLRTRDGASWRSTMKLLRRWQRHEIRAPQPDRLPRRAEELPAQGAGGFLQTMVPSGLPGRNRGR